MKLTLFTFAFLLAYPPCIYSQQTRVVKSALHIPPTVALSVEQLAMSRTNLKVWISSDAPAILNPSGNVACLIDVFTHGSYPRVSTSTSSLQSKENNVSILTANVSSPSGDGYALPPSLVMDKQVVVMAGVVKIPTLTNTTARCIIGSMDGTSPFSVVECIKPASTHQIRLAGRRISGGDSSATLSVDVTPETWIWFIATFNYAAGTFTVEINGVTATPVAFAAGPGISGNTATIGMGILNRISTSASSGLAITNTGVFTGSYRDFFVYDAIPTGSQMTELKAYLAARRLAVAGS